LLDVSQLEAPAVVEVPLVAYGLTVARHSREQSRNEGKPCEDRSMARGSARWSFMKHIA
jgi:hypothetical protein